jgi:RimJ/RimL family protein N-acetyltransferase
LTAAVTSDRDLGPAGTDRLDFRRWGAPGWEALDGEALLDIYSREEVYRYLGASPTPMAGTEEARERIQRWATRATPGRGLWAVLPSTAPDRPIGTVLLVPLPRSDGRPSDVHEIGWHFHPEAWGRGLATEAASAVIDLARITGLTEVRAVVYPANHASVRVCERLGMTARGLTAEWYGVRMLEFVRALA